MKRSFIDAVLGRTTWPTRVELVTDIENALYAGNGKLASFGLKILISRHGLEQNIDRDLCNLLTTAQAVHNAVPDRATPVLSTLWQRHIHLLNKAQEADDRNNTSTVGEAGLVQLTGLYFANHVEARERAGNPLKPLEWAYHGISEGIETLTRETKRQDPRLLATVRDVLKVLGERDTSAASDAAEQVLDAATLHVVPRWWSKMGMDVADDKVDDLPAYLQRQHRALMPVRQVAGAYLLKAS